MTGKRQKSSERYYFKNMDDKAKKRASNWTSDEEMVLVEQANLRDEALFGKMKGSGDIKISTVRQNAWQEIADILNARFTVKKRTLDEVKKKYYNLKQRSKEKYDMQKRPKTGGGPAPSTSQSEEALITHLTADSKAQLTGLTDGIDTDECAGDWFNRQKIDPVDAQKELSDASNLVKVAKRMPAEIEHFLKTHTVVNPVPRANDINIMGTLKGISETEVDHDDSETDLLVNYLCQTYSCLRNFKDHDLPSLINDLVIFINQSVQKDLESNTASSSRTETFSSSRPETFSSFRVETFSSSKAEEPSKGLQSNDILVSIKETPKGSKRKLRRPLAELERENLELDNARLIEETKRIKLNNENLLIEKEVLNLRKQELILKLQTQYPSLIEIMSDCINES